MIDEFGADYGHYIAFIAEFIKHSGCRASSGELEIYRVGKICSKCDRVECHIYPFRYFVICLGLFKMQWEQHHQDVQGIYIYYCRCVKFQCAIKHVDGKFPRHVVDEVIAVDNKKYDAC